GQGSSQLYTGWTALGLAAAGRNPLDVRRGGRSAIDFIRAHAGQLDDTGELERTILVLGAAGVSPRSFAGRDLVAELGRRARGDGSFAGGVVLSSFAILAYRAAGRPATATSVRRSRGWVARQQNTDGGVRSSRTSAQTPVWVTAQALAALSRRPLPIGRVPRGAHTGSAGAAGATGQATGAGATKSASAGSALGGPVPIAVLALAHEAGIAAAWL